MFILSREHWVRYNLVYGANSHPQLIWGDAVYLLNKDKFLEKIKSTESKQKILLLVKYLVILLAYGTHDYAIEIIDEVLSQNLISEATANNLKESVINSVISPVSYFIRHLVGTLLAATLYLIFLPLGFIRKRAAKYLKNHTKKLVYCWLTNVSRGGLNNSCISDIL